MTLATVLCMVCVQYYLPDAPIFAAGGCYVRSSAAIFIVRALAFGLAGGTQCSNIAGQVGAIGRYDRDAFWT